MRSCRSRQRRNCGHWIRIHETGQRESSGEGRNRPELDRPCVLCDLVRVSVPCSAAHSSFCGGILDRLKLLDRKDDKYRILDVTSTPDRETVTELKRSAGPKIAAGDTCFVVMPFAAPVGGYFQNIYEPAIQKAGLRAVRADADIFGTGKIIDQIWSGINVSKVLVAELTTRNPNVFYELGLAHALDKPVVLVSSNEEDVPFDLKHIRVIYYDVTDPFWGQKLIDKVAENIVSALKNPEEAVFKRALESK